MDYGRKKWTIVVKNGGISTENRYFATVAPFYVFPLARIKCSTKNVLSK